ncbi:hypothetical protein Bca52824_059822 [Brassica carinata]|uniref:CRIB domain-containing protein n=1 Tax=Brassica carinata TaxID=52824 RepID=A0A8X7QWA2_BRACI|nr:hypothetical protein Bca52824_059822 [Brassica carinata]
MSTRFKGIYQKSFKCFSDISDEKDEEMDIGYPTDVRHVSHIGWDSSSSSAPSWSEPVYYFSYSYVNSRRATTFLSQIHRGRLQANLKSAMEAFGEVESSKELGKKSTKQYLKKKLSSKASKLCNPWSPRFSRSSKVIA